mmetsp:Transcript_331/g.1115  ORF Transcript_331/g.1115 Transcript_331/m.1115 type:complete len:264 (-) Transcript_331:17-808(-)
MASFLLGEHALLCQHVVKHASFHVFHDDEERVTRVDHVVRGDNRLVSNVATDKLQLAVDSRHELMISLVLPHNFDGHLLPRGFSVAKTHLGKGTSANDAVDAVVSANFSLCCFLQGGHPGRTLLFIIGFKEQLVAVAHLQEDSIFLARDLAINHTVGLCWWLSLSSVVVQRSVDEPKVSHLSPTKLCRVLVELSGEEDRISGKEPVRHGSAFLGLTADTDAVTHPQPLFLSDRPQLLWARLVSPTSSLLASPSTKPQAQHQLF